MKPFPEDQLIAHLFGDVDDPAAVDAALAESAELRERFAELRRTLELVDRQPPPPRAEHYGAEVWSRLEPRLGREIAPPLRFPVRRRREGLPTWWSLAAAAVLLLAVGYLLGRVGPRSGPEKQIAKVDEPAAEASPALSDRGRERLLVAALSDHFGSSERLLTEVSNGSRERQVDPTLEQEWAAELLTANRLYRRAAEQAGQVRIARLLAELEPVFLELAHGGPEQANDEWNDLQRRIDERGLLFKVRVTGGRLSSSTPAVAPGV
jgi:hypothetical protein